MPELTCSACGEATDLHGRAGDAGIRITCGVRDHDELTSSTRCGGSLAAHYRSAALYPTQATDTTGTQGPQRTPTPEQL